MPKLPIWLFAFSNDERKRLTFLEVEYKRIQTYLNKLEDRRFFDLKTLPYADTEGLLNFISQYKDRIEVFHFSGHAGEEQIFTESGKLHANGLDILIQQMPNLKMVFLNGCATHDQVDYYLSKGVKAVIGTISLIKDDHAATFSEHFYKALSNEISTLQAAYEEAVGAIKTQHPDKYRQFDSGITFRAGRRGNFKPMPWRLYISKGEEAIADWKIQRPKSPDYPYPHKLTFIPTLSEKMIGRDKDLQTLRDTLLSSKQVVLMNGMGGIGKTTLAQAYVEDFGKEYQHIAWLEQTDTTENAFIGNEKLRRNLAIPDNVPSEQLLGAILQQLEKLDETSLLVIDNADEGIGDLFKHLPQPPKWHVLVTSRQELPHFKKMELDFLLEEDALDLFFSHYTRGERDEELGVEILKTIQYHTLSIELIAKTAHLQRITLPDLLQALKEKGAQLGKTANITTAHSGFEKIEKIFPYLLATFEVAQLEDKEKWLLQQMAALPSVFITYNTLYELLQVDKLEEEIKDHFPSLLDSVKQKSWLLYEAENDAYRMHAILQDVVLTQLQPSEDTYRLLIESVADKLYLDQDKENPVDKFQWVPYGENLIKICFNRSSPTFLFLLRNLGLRHQDIGQFEAAKELMEAALQSIQKIFGPDHIEVGTTQSNLGWIYQNLGQNEKALEVLELSLKNYQKNFGSDHPALGSIQSNLAWVYKNLGQYERAFNLSELALKNDLKNFGPDHPTIAVAKSILGLLHATLGRFSQGRDLMEEALSSDLKNFEPDHPRIATRKTNLGWIYQNLGQYERARDLLEDALHWDIKNLGTNHPKVAAHRSNLGIVYYKLKQNEQSRNLLREALNSLLRNFGPEHPEVAICQFNLANVCLILRQKKEAKKLLTSSYNILHTKFGPEHPQTKTVKEYLDNFED